MLVRSILALAIFVAGGAAPSSSKPVDPRSAFAAERAAVGGQAASFANVGEIDLGSSRLREQSAIVAPLPYSAQHLRAGITVDGLLGFETLAAFRTTVDYAARTLSLAPFDSPPPQGTTVHFLSDGAHAYVPVTIDGATGLFALDTGDGGGITVFRRFARTHGIFTSPGLQYVSTGGVGGTLAYSLYRANAMTIGGTTLAAPVVTVTDAAAGVFASRGVAGNIGARILERFRVTFDYRARTVTFAPNERVNERFPADNTGFSITQQNPDGFIVLSVVADSPAAAAGIKPGDRIVTIDGKSVATEHLGLGDVRALLEGRTAGVPMVIRRGTSDVNVVVQPRELV